mmetsp:Transcript_20965/g.41549  ORF Transcript_20965/g.41549 Transcript_20965/m.41549 type:complete len:115 (+) Transcript_20965:135-479(+)
MLQPLLTELSNQVLNQRKMEAYKTRRFCLHRSTFTLFFLSTSACRKPSTSSRTAFKAVTPLSLERRVPMIDVHNEVSQPLGGAVVVWREEETPNETDGPCIIKCSVAATCHLSS